MKYQKIYQALERRWQVSPGFRFADYTGLRRDQSRRASCPPSLLLIAEDRMTMQRIWIIQSGNHFGLAHMKMDTQYRSIGKPRFILCATETELACELGQLFIHLGQAA